MARSSIRESLGAKVASVRVSALLALPLRPRRASRKTYELIATMARRDPDRVVRLMSCHALKWAPPDVALPALFSVLESSSEPSSVRQEAMEALSYHPRDLVPASYVLGGLRDGSPAVRFFAAYTAGELGLDSLVDALHEMVLSDTGATRFGRVRTSAKRALERIRKAALEAQRRGASVRQVAGDAARKG